MKDETAWKALKWVLYFCLAFALLALLLSCHPHETQAVSDEKREPIKVEGYIVCGPAQKAGPMIACQVQLEEKLDE